MVIYAKIFVFLSQICTEFMRKKIIIILWIVLFVGIGTSIFLFSLIANGKIGYMPPVEELENPTVKFATQIFSEDGKTLGTYSLSKENRLYCSYDNLSPFLIQALVSTEDARFVDHSGIDGKALLRSLFKRILLQQKNAGGGSTLTQQLSKQLYSPSAENLLERIFQKPIEWVIAVKLERYYTKEEILAMYLNKFDFLHNAVGIYTASKTYFNCLPNELKIEQAATLVGMCKNPAYFNPLRREELTRGRRNVVLSQMAKADYVSKQELDSLQNLPLVLDYHSVDHKEGLATYFREFLRSTLTATKPNKNKYRGWQQQQYYEDSLAWATDPLYGFCNKNKNRDGKNYNLYTDGLKIHTTLNSHMQEYAEEAVKEHLGDYLQPAFFKELEHKSQAPFTRHLSLDEVKSIMDKAVKQTDRYREMQAAGTSEKEIIKAFHTKLPMRVWSWEGYRDTILTPYDSLKYYKSFLRAGFMSMDPKTGSVRAYVGGPEYSHFQYDMATKGRRQVGSTIKPFLYSLAMENGFTPCDLVRNEQQHIVTEDGKLWEPRNDSDKRIGDLVSLKWGLANSNNWISAYLINKLSPYALVRLIHSYGVENQAIEPTPSLCLGPCDISVAEMVSAYTTFANGGIRTAPLFVTKITDNSGNVIADFTPKMHEVISQNSAANMIGMLQAVVNEGTGIRLRYKYKFTAQIGGKTGTTNGNSDGWFMGVTPNLVSGCWVGGEDRDIHFDGMYYGQGAAMALPIWAEYMKKVYSDSILGICQTDTFTLPENYKPCIINSNDSNPILTQDREKGEGLDDYFE